MKKIMLFYLVLIPYTLFACLDYPSKRGVEYVNDHVVSLDRLTLKKQFLLDRTYCIFSEYKYMENTPELLNMFVDHTYEKMKTLKEQNRFIKEEEEKKSLVSAYYLRKLFACIDKKRTCFDKNGRKLKKKKKWKIPKGEDLKRLTRSVLPYYEPNHELYEKTILALRLRETRSQARFKHITPYVDFRYLNYIPSGCASDRIHAIYKCLKSDYEKLAKIVSKKRRGCFACLWCF